VITNNGTITFNGANDFNFNSTVAGSGGIVQSGAGVLTMSGNNSFTGNVNINSSSLILTNANALGNGTVVSNGGTLSSTVTLPRLVTSGAITLGSNIHTINAQTYNGAVTIASANTALVSDNANITFNGKLDAGLGSYVNATTGKSLTLTANNGAVTLNGNVGNAMLDTFYVNYDAYRTGSKNIYRLDVSALAVALNADVTTFENQTYTGAISVGDNGMNGITRTLISMDPNITFIGKVDDATANTHNLIVKSIAPPNSTVAPEINFNYDVGSIRAFKSFTTIIGYQDASTTLAIPGSNQSGPAGPGVINWHGATLHEYIPPAEPTRNLEFMGAVVRSIRTSELDVPKIRAVKASIDVGEAVLVRDDKVEASSDAADNNGFKKQKDQKSDCAITANKDCTSEQ